MPTNPMLKPALPNLLMDSQWNNEMDTKFKPGVY